VTSIRNKPLSFDVAIVATVAAITVTVTVLKCFLQVRTTPDSTLYIGLAKNLVTHFCYSNSPVEAGTCAPAWGHLQPPGYALFIALTQLAVTNSERLAVVAQTVMFSAAGFYFCWVLYLWHQSRLLLIGTITAAVLSPASFGWARFILTETLSATSVLLIFAEISRALQLGRVSALRMSICIILGMLLRWDLIFLIVPVLVALLFCFDLRRAFRLGCVITAICAVPYLVLMGRAVTVGLSPIPSIINAPAGILHYFRVAALDEGAAPFLWMILDRSGYGSVNDTLIGNHWVSEDFDKAYELIRRLAETPDGESVAPSLDDEFARVAEDISRDRFATYILLPLQRAGRMWWHWAGHQVVHTNWGLFGVLKFLFVTYSLATGVGWLAACLAKDRLLKVIAIAAFSFAVARTAFLVSFPISALEIRYLDLSSPTLEIIGLCGLWQIFAFKAAWLSD
jgi:hypothetical protein